MLSSVLSSVQTYLLGHTRLSTTLARILAPVERVIKVPLFGCHMCAQCVLHSTGMTCPMTCPKNLRNGPCGGVRLNHRCEVKPEMECVWVKAFRRSQRLPWPRPGRRTGAWAHELHDLRPPVDWSLKGGSSWVNYLTGRDQIASGCEPEPRTALSLTERHA